MTGWPGCGLKAIGMVVHFRAVLGRSLHRKARQSNVDCRRHGRRPLEWGRTVLQWKAIAPPSFVAVRPFRHAQKISAPISGPIEIFLSLRHNTAKFSARQST